MSMACGCCKGIEPLTPLSTANRPGLNALAYRVGDYATFFETMKARLSSPDFVNAAGEWPLASLKTREVDDPAIALLDAWAVVADVLTFYQERIANEGYLRTAAERRSILELSRLVGYTLRPGVAASVYLAYTVDQKSDTNIPPGSAVQSVPGPGELPQTFETADPLPARGVWTNLPPRMTQPQVFTPATLQPAAVQIYVDGTSANLKPNDRLMFDVGSTQILKRVTTVEAQFSQNRTKVILEDIEPAVSTADNPESTKAMPARAPLEIKSPLENMVEAIAPLSKPPADHPPNAVQLMRSAKQTFVPQADTTPALLATFHPEVKREVYTALENANVTPDPGIKAYAFRVQSSPFGSTAPLKPVLDGNGAVVGTEEWPLTGSNQIIISDVLPSGTFTRGDGGLTRSGAVPIGTLEGETVSVTIKQGTESASAVFLVSDQGNHVDIGKWHLNVARVNAANSTKYSFDFPSLKRTFLVEIKPMALDVNVDKSDKAIEVAVGQEVRSSAEGHRTSVAFRADDTTFFSIKDEAALPPSTPKVLPLDLVYDQVIPNSWVVVERADQDKPVIAQVSDVRKLSLSNYGISARVTQLTLTKSWLFPTDLMLSVARETSVSAQSEELKLAEEPIVEDIKGNRIELGALYGGLQSGRWLIVEGERTDIPNTSGVNAAELVMLSGVEQDVQKLTAPPVPAPLSDSGSGQTPGGPPSDSGADSVLPGDKTHTFLTLASPLAYSYKRDSVTIYGNVVRATHGETRNEVLGSGDASQELQAFALHQSPLTYVAASTPAGAQSTLQVRVNDLLWHEVGTLADQGPFDRAYVTQTDDADKTSVIFGNGEKGARLPTGVQNVKAVYRNGIGSPGNVAAKQLSLLSTRPLGVTAVINPLPATGGADRDTRDQARRNAPLGVTALDRLVSVQDYADFARTFAGIGKASAAHLSDGMRKLVYLTVAGTNDIPIATSSDLYKNLVEALQQFGDPFEPLEVASRELIILVIVAKVQVAADYQWDSVAPQIRAALLDTFGFDRRELGQDIQLSELITAIQLVPGVGYVDVTGLDGISEADAGTSDGLKKKLSEIANATKPKPRIPVRLATLDPEQKVLRPAQLAFLSPKLPDTLILTEIKQ